MSVTNMIATSKFREKYVDLISWNKIKFKMGHLMQILRRVREYLWTGLESTSRFFYSVLLQRGFDKLLLSYLLIIRQKYTISRNSFKGNNTGQLMYKNWLTAGYHIRYESLTLWYLIGFSRWLGKFNNKISIPNRFPKVKSLSVKALQNVMTAKFQTYNS